MAIYFTMHKGSVSALTVIFDVDGFEGAKRYKQVLVLEGKYTDQQITITGTDSEGRSVRA